MGQKHVSGSNLLVRVRAHTHTRGSGIISAMSSRYYDEFKKRLIEEDPVKRLSIYGACSGIVVGMQSHELGCPFDLFRCENEKIIWSRFAREEKWKLTRDADSPVPSITVTGYHLEKGCNPGHQLQRRVIMKRSLEGLLAGFVAVGGRYSFEDPMRWADGYTHCVMRFVDFIRLSIWEGYQVVGIPTENGHVVTCNIGGRKSIDTYELRRLKLSEGRVPKLPIIARDEESFMVSMEDIYRMRAVYAKSFKLVLGPLT